MGNINGYFEVLIKPDGTYIKIIPPSEGGVLTKIDEVSVYLNDRKISEYDIKEVNRIINKMEEAEVKLVDEQIVSADELFKLKLSENRMSATIRFFPPTTNGRLLTKEQIIEKLGFYGIKFGIIEKNIDSYLKNRQFCEDVLIAVGKAARDGKDAIIDYKFNIDKSAKPKLNEDGSVDFHQLDIISHVNKGDLIAELIPADVGDNGCDVTGAEVKPKKINKYVLKHGKNIHLSEDSLKMYTDVSGHVTLEGDKVFVSDTFEVLADVDASTGDITYEGNVTVKGNVRTGFKVRAKGDIIVDGVVEGGELYAEGQIILKRGIQGVNRGVLDAKGNVVAKFIESSTVRSGGSVSTEAIMHSKVSAKADIIVTGKKGFITGGEVRSGTVIKAKTAGSTMGTHTTLEVGIDPVVIDECRRLEKELATMKDEKEKIGKILTVLKKRMQMGEQLSPDKQQQLQAATRNSILLDSKIKTDTELYEKYQEELAQRTEGRIKIESVAYPGVKIVISNVVYFVRNEIKYSQFLRDRADIKITGY